MSASSSNGSSEPLKHVCCGAIEEYKFGFNKLKDQKEGVWGCTNHLKLLWSNVSISINVEFLKSRLRPVIPFLRVVLLQLVDVYGGCNEL